MAIFGNYFTYNGISSKEFDLVLASFETINNFEMGLNQSLITGDMNKYRNHQNYNGKKYGDVLSFQFSVIKTPYKNGKQQYITRNDVRKINKWMTRCDSPAILHFDDDEEYIDYICLITDVDNTAYDGRIVELKYTATCISPYGYSKLKTFETTTSTEVNFSIVVDSDDTDSCIYPLITITPSSSGTVKIMNADANKSLYVYVKKELPITINCELQQFYDEIGLLSLEDIGIVDVSDIYIPSLKDGENNFSISGNCTVKFEWREPRKVGAY